MENVYYEEFMIRSILSIVGNIYSKWKIFSDEGKSHGDNKHFSLYFILLYVYNTVHIHCTGICEK